MTLRKTLEVIAELAESGVIRNYAVAGAIAALNYIQPTMTEDLDILVSVDAFEKRASGLLLLGPLEKALADLGYTQRDSVGYRVGDWPVQFLPVASELDEEALKQAAEVDIREGSSDFKVRVLRAEHLVAIAVRVGRLKDLARIDAFLEQDAVDLEALKSVLQRHKLMDAWKDFCLKASRKNPLAAEGRT